eukprot:gene16866-23136_t
MEFSTARGMGLRPPGLAGLPLQAWSTAPGPPPSLAQDCDCLPSSLFENHSPPGSAADPGDLGFEFNEDELFKTSEMSFKEKGAVSVTANSPMAQWSEAAGTVNHFAPEGRASANVGRGGSSPCDGSGSLPDDMFDFS